LKDKSKKVKYLLTGAAGGAVCGLFGAAGGAVGALFLKNVRSALLRRIFAIFIIYSAARFVFS